jgi:hypothetical protein
MVEEPTLMPVMFGGEAGVVAPPSMNTVDGEIVAFVESLLVKVIVSPLGGAGAVRVMANGRDWFGLTVRLPGRPMVPEGAPALVSVKAAGIATPAADAVT